MCLDVIGYCYKRTRSLRYNWQMKCPQDLHDLNRLQYLLCTFVCDHRRNKRFAVYVYLYRLTVWIQKVGYCRMIVSLFWCIDISSVYKFTFRKRFGHHKRFKYDISWHLFSYHATYVQFYFLETLPLVLTYFWLHWYCLISNVYMF